MDAVLLHVELMQHAERKSFTSSWYDHMLPLLSSSTRSSTMLHTGANGGGGDGCGDGGDGDGGGDSSKLGVTLSRVPQSTQSVPKLQMEYSAPAPPSSQSPSEANRHELKQS